MKRTKDWVIPTISFCTFVIMIVMAILLAYGKITPIGKTYKTQESQQNVANQEVTNIKDFQKALDSSLK